MGNLTKKNCIKFQFFRVKSPSWTWGSYGGFDTLSLPHYGAFEIRLCQIHTIAPLSPEGWGVVGQYIDRCITVSIDILVRAWLGALPVSSLGTKLNNESLRIGIRLGAPIVVEYTCVFGGKVDVYGTP